MQKENKLNIDIFKGKAGKKVLFQPRIACWYDDKMYYGQKLPGKYENCDLVQLYEKLNVSNRIYEYTGCFDRIFDKSVVIKDEKISICENKRTFKTPIGEICSITKNSIDTPGSYYSKWLVENVDDIKIASYVEDASYWRFNQNTYDIVHNKWGEIGEPTMFITRTNLQECLIESMGVENTVFALNDECDVMETYFAAIDNNRHRLIDAIKPCPIKIINYGDNIHCGLTPPRLFEKYVIPEYYRRKELFSGSEKFIHSHWDGDVKTLLKYAKDCGLDGIEAITPLPQGDVSLEEVRDALGDKIILLDGIAALLFNEYYKVDLLVEQVETLIKYFAGKLILGISDEMPSNGLIERVELVRDIVEAHNRKCEEGKII